MNRICVVGLLSLTAAACSQAPESRPSASNTNPAAVRAAIEAANHTWEEAAKRGDAQALANLISENSTNMSADGTDIVGREAIVDAFAKNLAARTYEPVEVHIITDSVEVHGDFAYEIGHNVNLRRPKGNAKAAVDTVRSRYITFWRKDSDGTWRSTRDFTVATPSGKKS